MDFLNTQVFFENRNFCNSACGKNQVKTYSKIMLKKIREKTFEKKFFVSPSSKFFSICSSCMFQSLLFSFFGPRTLRNQNFGQRTHCIWKRQAGLEEASVKWSTGWSQSIGIKIRKKITVTDLEAKKNIFGYE